MTSKSSKEDLVVKLYYDPLAKPFYFSYSGKLQKNVKHTQNFKTSMITMFFVIYKDEMLSCMEPEALKNRV